VDRSRLVGTAHNASIIFKGVTVLSAAGWTPARRARVGRAAPRTGFPDLDWGRDGGAVTLRFPREKTRG